MENRKHYLFTINPILEKDGFLTVFEEEKQIPFKIKRVFYEYGLKETCSRGEHANKHSRFCMVSVHGKCDVTIQDGKETTTYKLDNPNKVLFVDKMVWKTMTNFSKDCVLLVLSDYLYDKDEYIRDFDEFLKLVK